jgi:hypothetical protein
MDSVRKLFNPLYQSGLQIIITEHANPRDDGSKSLK